MGTWLRLSGIRPVKKFDVGSWMNRGEGDPLDALVAALARRVRSFGETACDRRPSRRFLRVSGSAVKWSWGGVTAPIENTSFLRVGPMVTSVPSGVPECDRPPPGPPRRSNVLS